MISCARNKKLFRFVLSLLLVGGAVDCRRGGGSFGGGRSSSRSFSRTYSRPSVSHHSPPAVHVPKVYSNSFSSSNSAPKIGWNVPSNPSSGFGHQPSHSFSSSGNVFSSFNKPSISQSSKPNSAPNIGWNIPSNSPNLFGHQPPSNPFSSSGSSWNNFNKPNNAPNIGWNIPSNSPNIFGHQPSNPFSSSGSGWHNYNKPGNQALGYGSNTPYNSPSGHQPLNNFNKPSLSHVPSSQNAPNIGWNIPPNSPSNSGSPKNTYHSGVANSGSNSWATSRFNNVKPVDTHLPAGYQYPQVQPLKKTYPTQSGTANYLNNHPHRPYPQQTYHQQYQSHGYVNSAYPPAGGWYGHSGGYSGGYSGNMYGYPSSYGGGYGNVYYQPYHGSSSTNDVLQGLLLWRLMRGSHSHHYTVRNYYNSGTRTAPVQLETNKIIDCPKNATQLCPSNTTPLCTSTGSILCVTNATVPCDNNSTLSCVNSTVPQVPCVNGSCNGTTSNVTSLNIPCLTNASIFGDLKDSNSTLLNSTWFRNSTVLNGTQFCVAVIATPVSLNYSLSCTGPACHTIKVHGNSTGSAQDAGNVFWPVAVDKMVADNSSLVPLPNEGTKLRRSIQEWLKKLRSEEQVKDVNINDMTF